MSKDEFITALGKEGFSAGYANHGVPTVFVKDASDIHQARMAITKFIKQNGYTESYGISLNPVKESHSAVALAATL